MVLSVPVTAMAAYGYSRFRFRGRRVLFFGVLVTQILPATALVILRPLVTPAIAATAVFVFVNAWQDYLLASSLITNNSDFTVNVGLYSFEGAVTTNWGAILATSVLVSLPSVVMFATAQRYFVRVVTGGVKG